MGENLKESKPKNFSNAPLRDKIHEVIFEADTAGGKLFDVVLLIAILLSVVILMLESVPSYQTRYGDLFYRLEFVLTILFTIEYFLRLYSVYNPKKYALSFFGIIDLLSILPFYLSMFIGGTQSLMIIRGLRLMRIFRIFKLGHYIAETDLLINSLKKSRRKILVFMSFILILVCIFGSTMYLIEGQSNSGFDSIPRSIYWAIVTLTTVGYGDISPVTPLGQFIAAIIMIAGYAIIAVPTGIVTSEIVSESRKQEKAASVSTQSCKHCAREGHDNDAIYCKYCGGSL